MQYNYAAVNKSPLDYHSHLLFRSRPPTWKHFETTGVSLKRFFSFCRTWVEVIPILVKVDDCVWHQRWNKSQHTSQLVTAGTVVNGLKSYGSFVVHVAHEHLVFSIFELWQNNNLKWTLLWVIEWVRDIGHLLVQNLPRNFEFCPSKHEVKRSGIGKKGMLSCCKINVFLKPNLHKIRLGITSPKVKQILTYVFLMHTVTRQTCWINLIMTVKVPMK